MSVRKTQETTTRTTSARIDCDFEPSDGLRVMMPLGAHSARLSVVAGGKCRVILRFEADTLRDAAELFNQLADELDRSDG